MNLGFFVPAGVNLAGSMDKAQMVAINKCGLKNNAPETSEPQGEKRNFRDMLAEEIETSGNEHGRAENTSKNNASSREQAPTEKREEERVERKIPRNIYLIFQQLVQSGLISQEKLGDWFSSEKGLLLETGNKDFNEIIGFMKQAGVSGNDMNDTGTFLLDLVHELSGVKSDGNEVGDVVSDLEKILSSSLKNMGKGDEEKTVVASLDDHESPISDDALDALIGKLTIDLKNEAGKKVELTAALEDMEAKNAENDPLKFFMGMKPGKMNLNAFLKGLLEARDSLENGKGTEKSDMGLRNMTFASHIGLGKAMNQPRAVSGHGLEKGLENSFPVVDQIVQAVSIYRQDGQYSMRLALRPPELGHVNVSLVIRGHHVQAVFMVDNPVTHGLLTHQVPELRSQLTLQGLKLNDISIQMGGGSSQGFQPFRDGARNFSEEAPWKSPGREKTEIINAIGGSSVVEGDTGGIMTRAISTVDRINVFV